MKYLVWDIETLKNFFSLTAKFVGESIYYCFEISTRKNEREGLVRFLNDLAARDVTMVGFNSLSFDYPIIHDLLSQPYTFDYTRAHNMAQDIIESQAYGKPQNYIKPSNRLIKQLDLVKLNHFDNINRRVSLKVLQFNMRSKSVEDMPVGVNEDLSEYQMEQVLKYNLHDVTETEEFFNRCHKLVDLRLNLIKDNVIYGDVLNYSDVKIGQEYLISKIGKDKCYTPDYKPKQTIRHKISFQDIILPNMYHYYTDKCNEVIDWFKSVQVTIPIPAGESPRFETNIAGIDFTFALGGVHASVTNKIYKSDDTHGILDVDVSGMYVSVAVANGFYPQHLGESFVKAYRELKEDRVKTAKGSTMNAVLKLAGNGVYGNSNNKYSVFYDPKYTYTVTVNGQLQLLMLAERLSLIPGVELIQANTDGITLYYPKDQEILIRGWCKDWERVTKLELEYVDYSGMWIADVNNYIAVTTKGKIKRKGKYWYPENDDDYEGQWAKDFSKMVVPKVASVSMLNSLDDDNINALLKLHQNPYDFLHRYRARGKSEVFIGDVKQQRTTRYYVSKLGHKMIKKDPPRGVGYKRKSKLSDRYFESILNEVGPDTWDERIHTKNKSKYKEVTTGIESGHEVRECNNIKDFNWGDVDYDYYFNEVKKLIIGGQA